MACLGPAGARFNQKNVPMIPVGDKQGYLEKQYFQDVPVSEPAKPGYNVKTPMLYVPQTVLEARRDPEEKGGVFTLYPGFACSETGGILGVLFFKIPRFVTNRGDLDSTV